VVSRQVKSYAVGHYWLGIVNDVFNDVSTSDLVTCFIVFGQQCGAVLLGTVAVPNEWSTALALCCSHTIATCLIVLTGQSC
jgi:hypothetical protein